MIYMHPKKLPILPSIPNPNFNIEGEKLYMSTMDIVGIPATMLGNVIDNYEDRRTEIVDALDFLVNGF